MIHRVLSDNVVNEISYIENKNIFVMEYIHNKYAKTNTHTKRFVYKSTT
jgi:hypothetical protein